MPSPFPGMDPYLESPTRWPGVHHRLISEIQTSLNRLLRPKYYVSVEERVYLSDDTDPGRVVIIPDARIIPHPAGAGLPPPKSSTATATLDVAQPIEVTTLLDEEVREASLEVLDVASERVVTVIELLSPTNKIVGSRGRLSFIEKRNEVIRSTTTHWVEIDLLRNGDRIMARETYPPCEYLAYVSRVSRRPKARIWPIRLRQRLPEVEIPLVEGDADVKLDLQEVLDRGYDNGAYDLAINYELAPVPPLPPADAEWADELLRKKGLRK